MPLIGRARELTLLEESLDEALHGRGSIVLLSGEPGVGKTRLADELARRARPSATTMWGRAWEAGGAPPFWPWIQIARALARRGVASPLAERSETPHVNAAADRFVLFDAMERAIHEASELGPLVVLFDDLHAADAASLRLLTFLVPALADIPVLVVGTYRDVEARAVPEMSELSASVARAGRTIAVERLGREDVAELARAEARTALDENQLESLYLATGGNPLFVCESVRAGSNRVPESVRAAIRGHLRGLPAAIRPTLDLAAIIGRELSATTLAQASQRTADSVVADLGEAVAAGVLVETMPSRFAFAHGLFREVLHDDVDNRSELHRRVAETLEQSHASDPSALAEIARHWSLAGVASSAHALDAFRRAAEHAERSLAFESATESWEGALAAHERAAPGDTLGAFDLQLSIAKAAFRAGRVPFGKQACLRAAAIARDRDDATRFAEAALTHASAVTPGAVDDARIELLEEALAREGGRDAATRARLVSRLAAARQPAYDPRGPIALAREAVALVQTNAVDDTVRLAVLHAAMAALVDFVDPEERKPINAEIERLAERLGDRTTLLQATARGFHDCAEGGDLEGAAAKLDRYELLARAFPQPHVRIPIELGRSALALLSNRTGESEGHLAAARRIRDRTGDGYARLAVGMHEIAALRITRRHDELSRRASELRNVVSLWRDYPASFDAMVAARVGDHDAATKALAQLDREHVRVCMDTMMLAWVAEAAAFVGDAAIGTIVDEALAPLESQWVSWSGVAFVVEGPVANARALAASARRGQAAHRESASPPQRIAERVTFERSGDVWVVEGEGGRVPLKTTRGLEWLAALVGAPRVEVHVLDLVGGSDTGDAGDMLDEDARRAYRTRLAKLRVEVDEAESNGDDERADRARSEIDALAAELSRAVGLGGRVRRAGAATERARINVQRRIADAIRRISDAHPPLGRHLANAVRTGAFCSYSPERDGGR